MLFVMQLVSVLLQTLLFILVASSAQLAWAEDTEGPSSFAPQVQPKEQSKLNRAEDQFGSGSFAASANEISSLLIDDTSLSKQDRYRLYLLKARLDLAFGNDANLDIWLGKAFKADPSVNLDPLKDPPALLSRWALLLKKSENAPPAESVHPKSKSSSAEIAGVDSRGKSFAMGLMPFGLGHLNAERYKDAALFFSVSLVPTLIAMEMPSARIGSNVLTTPRRPEFFTATTLLGIYGYQLLDLSPELFDRNAAAAQTVYAGLSFAPFGVGQLRNDEPLKAITFALVEGTALSIAAVSSNTQQANMATAVFAGTTLIGIVDAFYGYRNANPAKKTNSGLSIWPLFTENQFYGVSLSQTFN